MQAESIETDSNSFYRTFHLADEPTTLVVYFPLFISYPTKFQSWAFRFKF